MSSPEFWQGVEEFNQQQFYACHDTLEAIWLEAPELDKRFYQGVLQVAVACYHLRNYNWQGAVMLLGEAVRRLRDYPTSYQGIDVDLLLQQSLQLLQSLQQIKPEQIEMFVRQLETKQQTTADEDDSGLAASSPSTPQPDILSETDLTGSCRLPQIVRVS